MKSDKSCIIDIEPISGTSRIKAAGCEFHKTTEQSEFKYWHCKYKRTAPKVCQASIRQSFNQLLGINLMTCRTMEMWCRSKLIFQVHLNRRKLMCQYIKEYIRDIFLKLNGKFPSKKCEKNKYDKKFKYQRKF